MPAAPQGLLVFSRLGVYIRLPGVDVDRFAEQMQARPARLSHQRPPALLLPLPQLLSAASIFPCFSAALAPGLFETPLLCFGSWPV